MSFSKFATKAQILSTNLINDAMDDYHSWLLYGRPLGDTELDYIITLSDEGWKNYIKQEKLTRGGQMLGKLARAFRDYDNEGNWTTLSMKELCAKMMAYNDIKQVVNTWDDYDLPVGYDLSRQGLVWEMLRLNIKYEWQAQKMLELYRDFSTPGRTFRSCYQPTWRMAVVATTPEYWCLPSHTLKGIIQGNFKLPSDRLGNIWSFIPAVKAWNVCPNLPKKIAVRIGKMDLWKRYAASIAWKQAQTIGEAEFYTSVVLERYEKESVFWQCFDEQCQKGKGAILLHLLKSENKYFNKVGEGVLNIPLGYLAQNNMTPIEALQRFLDPKDALQGLFGVSSKSLIKTWQEKNISLDTLNWVINLAPSQNIDWINRFLSVDNCIPFCSECVDFLKSLSPSRALTLIQTYTYKHRGEIHELKEFHFRDTGMLFNNLFQRGITPQLGRVRCWLSAHEDLARQYVAILPNEPIKVSPQWEPVDGLSAVDGSWYIELPQNTAQLKYWGERLHNCVGGYGSQINAGRSVVFVVYFHGSLKYCVEVQGEHIKQFYGQRNSSPDYAEKDAVLAPLLEAGLIKN